MCGEQAGIHTNPRLTLLDFSTLQVLDGTLHMEGNGAGLSCTQVKQACANTKRTDVNACNSAVWTTEAVYKGRYGHQLTTC